MPTPQSLSDDTWDLLDGAGAIVVYTHIVELFGPTSQLAAVLPGPNAFAYILQYEYAKLVGD